MKKIITLAIVLLFSLIVMSTNVQAAEVVDSETLKEALEGTEDTVELITDNISVAEEIKVSSPKTLDLNGKTLNLSKNMVVDGTELIITGNGIIKSDNASDLIVVKQGSILTVKNGVLSNLAKDNGVIRVEGSATDTTEKTKVTIQKDATLSGNYCIYVPASGGHGVAINVYGTLKGISGNNGYNEGSIGISVNGKLQSTTGNVPMINIYDGAVIETTEGTSGDTNMDDAPAIYAAGYANWNIYGGTIKGSEALSIKAGKFNITGGTLVANGKYVNPAVAAGSASEATGSAISITANDGYSKNVELYISNSNVSSKNGYAISESTTKGTGTAISAISISSGNFVGNEERGAILIVNADEVGKFITGGTFSSDVGDYIIVDEDIEQNPGEGTEEEPEQQPEQKPGQEVKPEQQPEQDKDKQPNENKDEKDETPKTGLLNIPSYVWIAVIAIVAIVTLKRRRI